MGKLLHLTYLEVPGKWYLYHHFLAPLDGIVAKVMVGKEGKN